MTTKPSTLLASVAAIVRASTDAIVVVDERGIIIATNKQAESLFGFSSEDLLESTFEVLLCESSASQKAENRLQNLMSSTIDTDRRFCWPLSKFRLQLPAAAGRLCAQTRRPKAKLANGGAEGSQTTRTAD